jgi:hypothetical protein
MITSILPIKDSTIYEYYNLKNTGIDSILELSYDTLLESASRILIQFDSEEIRNKIINKNNIQFDLRLYLSDQYEVPEQYTIETFPLSQSWNMGIGKYNNEPQTTDGVTWNNNGVTNWISSGSNYHTEYMTNSGGGSWNSNISSSISFDYNSNDININVTDIVNLWLSGSIDNNGLILKLKDEYTEIESEARLTYFSKETHTIYQPKIIIKYEDYYFNSGSLQPITDENFTININNLRKQYNLNSMIRLYLTARERYPNRTYVLTNEYLIPKYLPINSYYSIKDGNSETTIIPFDDVYTKISLDENGNYFELDMNNFNAERYYKIIFKIVWDNFEEFIIDNNFYFKVVR